MLFRAAVRASRIIQSRNVASDRPNVYIFRFSTPELYKSCHTRSLLFPPPWTYERPEIFNRVSEGNDASDRPNVYIFRFFTPELYKSCHTRSLLFALPWTYEPPENSIAILKGKEPSDRPKNYLKKIPPPSNIFSHFGSLFSTKS